MLYYILIAINWLTDAARCQHKRVGLSRCSPHENRTVREDLMGFSYHTSVHLAFAQCVCTLIPAVEPNGAKRKENKLNRKIVF